MMLRIGISLAALVFGWGLDDDRVHAVLVDFEGLTTGVSVNGQAGWTTEDEFGNSTNTFDEEVVDDGTGNTVWRVSNAVVTGGFSDLPNSHTTPNVAGETGSALWNDRGSDHTMPLSPPNPGNPVTTNEFFASFRFKSATEAPQTGLQMSVSAAAKQSAFRNSYLNIVDDGANGFDLTFYETGMVGDAFGASSVSTEVASDLSYDQWHTVEMSIEFVDGIQGSMFGNDIVTVKVDGVPVHTGSTWETFYRPGPFPPIPAPQLQAVDAILFRLNNEEAGTLGNGLFFDDVEIGIDAAQDASVPEPSSLTLAIWLLATTVCFRRRCPG